MTGASHGSGCGGERRPGRTMTVPKDGFQGVSTHAGDDLEAVDSDSACTPEEPDSSDSDDERKVPQTHSMLMKLQCRRSWRCCWCCLALRHARELMRTGTGRLRLSRAVGLVFLTSAVVAFSVLRWQGLINARVAYIASGSCIGVMAGLCRVPGSSDGMPLSDSSRPYACVGITTVSLVLVLDPLRHQGIWREQEDIKLILNLIAVSIMMPISIVSITSRHPRSKYMRDAIWCIAGLWIMMMLWILGNNVRYNAKALDHETRTREISVQYLFWSMSYNLEGVVFVWIARLMLARMRELEPESFWVTRRSAPATLVMCVVFPCKMWCELMLPEGHLLGWRGIYICLTALFLAVWLLYSGILAKCLARCISVLRKEAERTRDSPAPWAEAMWAADVLKIELVANLILTVTTIATWSIRLTYVMFKNPDLPRSDWSHTSKDLLQCVMASHRFDYVVNAVSLAVLSGLIWQPRMRASALRGTTLSCIVSDSLDVTAPIPSSSYLARQVWKSKVNELAHRGIRLDDLLKVWEQLMAKRTMPHFDPRRSTTNDVVRQIIIPQSRSPIGGGGMAYASVRSKKRGEDGALAKCMVTHNWTNLFWHLVAAVVASQLGHSMYASVAEDLLRPGRRQKLRQKLASKGVLDMTFWICAFSINQHAGICDGFGPQRDEGTPEFAEFDAKRRDSVTGDVFKLCNCREIKRRYNEPALCEMNKFDEMMRHLDKLQPGCFSHLIVVDVDFDVFTRAWCVAEIVESDRSNFTQRIMIHSKEALDKHYDRLLLLDVRKCNAALQADKDEIMDRIGDEKAIDAFNCRLAWAIFGDKGIFSGWYDAQQRARLVGHILQRARATAAMSGGDGGEVV
eukprot:CAMPEP_0176045110 /NCGR_PEP_ID=MMETSP0120_2-20121206/22391_1 /TAXON_ID=160619 /ORGANISM="Kryptoperidinium foliaceum, Strain CCMP 1326" /LENGTH=854 /DNA_ID=CAMNT_0017378515 /DNA_START=41 /DNA_END=2605 /DNA_ORIENTATION=+